MKTKCIFSFYHSNINIIFVSEYHKRMVKPFRKTSKESFLEKPDFASE